jgi:hypothetical protein
MSIWNGALPVAMGRWAGAASSTTKGCTITQGSGTGNYLVTLDQGLGANECVVIAMPEAQGQAISAVNTSNTVKTLTMASASNLQNAANGNFTVLVMQLPGT